MAYRDVLLTLASYPDATPPAAVETAIGFAAAIGARISALACEVHVPLPGSFLSPALLDVAGMAGAESRKAKEQAEAALGSFRAVAEKQGVFDEAILDRCMAPALPRVLTEYARLRDLAAIAVEENALRDQPNAEALVFESGRPVLLLPRTAAKPFALDTVTVAWDFSRPATRAVADAMPVLVKAKRVHVVTVTNEKRIDTRRSGPELAKHLARHDVEVVLDEIDAAGRGIGAVLAEAVGAGNSDLLVMGAFGHSRWREFVLGGATRSMMTAPPVPVLFSH